MKFILFILLFHITLANTFRPLTVLMEFPDYSHGSLHERETALTNGRRGDEFTRELYSQMFFNPVSYKGYNGEELMSARRFFHLESGGSFSLQGDISHIYGWYTAEKDASFYGQNTNKTGDRKGAASLVREAIERLIEDDVDFSRYDLDGDGMIDGLIIVYAGRGEQFPNSLGSDAIWPHYNTFADISRGSYADFEDSRGKKWMVNKYSLVPQDLPMDLYVHEIGHFLGLSDLYGRNSTTGFWSNMGYLYCGKIPGSKLNALGAYHRNNLQNRYEYRDITTFWAHTKEYDLKDIEDPVFINLHNSNNKKSDNLIKINLPGKRQDIPIKPGKTFYSDNYFNQGSSFTLTTTLPKHTDNRLLFEVWFNSIQDKRSARLYVRKTRGDRWTLLRNTRRHEISHSDSRKWLHVEYDLNMFSGQTVEIRGVLLPSIKEWRKGVYLSDIRVTADRKNIFDIKKHRNMITFTGFSESQGQETIDRYILIEYRYPVKGRVDEGLLETPLDIPYPKGIIAWYIDEDYKPPDTLVSLLPLSDIPVYEVVEGRLKPMDDMSYIVSGWVASSNLIPEVAVEKNKRFFYRDSSPGKPSLEVVEGIFLKIIKEDPSRVMLTLEYRGP